MMFTRFCICILPSLLYTLFSIILDRNCYHHPLSTMQIPPALVPYPLGGVVVKQEHDVSTHNIATFSLIFGFIVSFLYTGSLLLARASNK